MASWTHTRYVRYEVPIFSIKTENYFPLVGTSLSNKTATVKSLTSKRLTDFLENSNKSIEDQTNHSVSSSKISNNVKTYDKYSIINLEPTMFETDEIVNEAPLLFVGKESSVNPTQNLQEIIESYKIFKEITSIEDKEYLIEENQLA